MDTKPLRLLIADDNDSDRLILKTILEKQGHVVFSASDGAEALVMFQKEAPDLVLLDALMPVMNGFEAARAIKLAAYGDLVPIIFITSLKDAASLADCLKAGGDDFISKPYNRIILHAKIQAHARMRRLHEVVQEQRDKISKHNDHLMREQEVAKAVFDNIAHSGCIDAPNIKSLLSPMAVFNGDMVLVAKKPADGMYVLLGDFTGHGLPAAIGALPASEIFYGMSRKGFTMQEILREINRKLKQILPVGVFCCACMLDLSFHEGMVKIWMGGLPDLIIFRTKTKKMERIRSAHLPLGVLSDEKLLLQLDVLHLDYGDKIYVWSDGIHEALNAQGEMFGTQALDQVFHNNNQADDLFDEVLHAVKVFTGDQAQDDDYTMVEVSMANEHEVFNDRQDEDEGFAKKLIVMDCTITCELRPDSLRTFNPLPLVTHYLREIPGLKNHSGKLYTVIAELYSNALEHGLLRLSSSLKNSAQGFASYYKQRTLALDALKSGCVTIKLNCEPLENRGGRLKIRVEDSGFGFDHENMMSNQLKKQGYSGRGIPLILSMCQSVIYYGNGNAVEVVFDWD